MVYLGDTPIAGTSTAEAQTYTDNKIAAAQETSVNIASTTPSGTFNENDVWFITTTSN